MLDQHIATKNMATGDAPIKINAATVQVFQMPAIVNPGSYPGLPLRRNPYRVRIEAEGPFGAIEPLEYVISLDGLDGSRAAPPGNLHAVAAELHEMTKATKELEEAIRSASLEPA